MRVILALTLTPTLTLTTGSRCASPHTRHLLHLTPLPPSLTGLPAYLTLPPSHHLTGLPYSTYHKVLVPHPPMPSPRIRGDGAARPVHDLQKFGALALA